MLFDLAKREGVAFKFNSRVVDVNSTSGCVELHSGELLYADIIVGADGYNSIIRPLVTELDDFQNLDMHLFLNLVVPVDLLRVDTDLGVLTNPRGVSVSLLNVDN